MKIRSILILAFAMFSLETLAQNPNPVRFGFQLNRFQNDFGIGIHLHSPRFYKFNIVVKANMNYLDHLDTKNENHIWTPYGLFQLGLKTNSFITPKINLYGEGGIVGIQENQEYSTNAFGLGGYGLFGFEFYFTEGNKRNPCYFIELGGNGVGAVAEKVSGRPNYANGFITSVGFRF